MAASDKDSPEVRNESGHSADQGPDGPGEKSIPDASHATAHQANDEHRTLIRDRSERPAGLFARGEIIGERYRILDSLGRGGMGEVWKAFDLKLRVEVALKSLRHDLFADEQRRELLRQEVKLARDVISPNVCRVFDLEIIDGQELVSMEYIDGETLEEILAKRGPLDLREAGEIASQFLAGLGAIHESGLIHRDLKPENLMITRTGRVVIMDFGVAKAAAESSGTVAGTMAYMAPEQARGEVVDARADVFASGVILAEMMDPAGFTLETRRRIWEGARRRPPVVPESPWKAVILCTVAANREGRPRTARALARALEDVTLRVDGADDLHPYPGLSSFTEDDAEYFFGREAEVEALWKKLQSRHLLALIGPSGAGKSSFLRAGLLPAKPDGWVHLLCQPGDAPFGALAQALVPQLSGDTEALRELVRFEDSAAARSVMARWRSMGREAFLVVDQFEELFTLNPIEVQERFTELLGSLALEGGVRVLLSMRDDFLFRCHDFPALSPILSELTLLGPPAGAALRRALVQPALACGYRFEDDSMVDEMLDEVASERGALPLLAFAASRLWDGRDRESGTLTRTTYESIGGVGGALARHAEETLEQLGDSRRDMVREVFRNLVTAEGTRATREMDELLSVFEDREGAQEVVTSLIDARLLTSYDIVETPGEHEGSQRVEIVHESLLDAWPRLVRWRTQDEDGAQLRDQLRQAAKMWEERDRSEDLLWSGTAYFDYRAWRQRYSGGLSDTEEAFAEAMVSRANRQRRGRRIAVGVLVVSLSLVLGIFGLLWRQSERAGAATEVARQEAVEEARRAEASKLLALGRLEVDETPTAAVAYALASLDLVDNPSARRFALDALGRAPTAFSLGAAGGRPHAVEFSPDGQWLATGTLDGKITVISRNDGVQQTFDAHKGAIFNLSFSADSAVLASFDARSELGFWSIPDGKSLGRFEMGGGWRLVRIPSTGRRAITITSENQRIAVREFPLRGGEGRLLGLLSPDVPMQATTFMDIDPGGRWLGYAHGRKLFLLPLDGIESATPRLVGSHETEIRVVRFHPDGKRVVSADEGGESRVWSLDPGSQVPLRVVRQQEPPNSVHMDAGGSWLAAVRLHQGGSVSLTHLDGPPDAEPLVLHPPGGTQVGSVAFDPQGQWIATTDLTGLFLWPLAHPYTLRLGGEEGGLTGMALAPDDSWVARGGGSRLWVWSLTGSSLLSSYPATEGLYGHSAAHPDGNRVMLGTLAGPMHLFSISGLDALTLEGFPSLPFTAAFSSDGRFAAAGGGSIVAEHGVIRIWDLETGEVRVLDPPKREFIGSVEFTPDGDLVVASASGVWLWKLPEGTHQQLQTLDAETTGIATLSGDGRKVVSFGVAMSTSSSTPAVFLDLDTGAERVLDAFGTRLSYAALDERGEFLVTGSQFGEVQFGPTSGDEEPHLLLGHEEWVFEVGFAFDDSLIVSAELDGPINIRPVPTGRPFQTLPYDELRERLRLLTNYRVVEDPSASTGYSLDAEPFKGWAKPSTW